MFVLARNDRDRLLRAGLVRLLIMRSLTETATNVHSSKLQFKPHVVGVEQVQICVSVRVLS